ncbi:MAG: hypothetical protein OER88_07820 [Planctomycetota bacterium]|nr:hypothetical protein [Planctomycetota bacterium]
MSQPEKTPRANKAQQAGAVVGIVVGIIGFQRFWPEKTEPGFDFMRVVWAALVGGGCAGLGAIIGALIDRRR